jgi:cell division protein FtsQ
VGGRRWDLRFHSGETLALPEGTSRASRALGRFAAMDRKSQLLGRGFARFDMRIAGTLTVRVTSEPGSIVPADGQPMAVQPAPVQAAPARPVARPPADVPPTAETI